MEAHVVRGSIPVVIRDVMDGAHRQDDLAQRVNDGQVNNSPAHKEAEEQRRRGETSSTRRCRSNVETARNALLVLSQPGVGYDCPQDGRQVAQRHKRVVDGGSKVLVPVQEVVQVKHQHGCGGVNVVGVILRLKL